MNKKILALLTAGVLALVGVFAVVAYANGAEKRAYAGAEMVSVLVVSDAVPANSPADRLGGSVKTVRMPRSAVAEGAVTDLASLGGEVTNVALVPGEQLLTARFGEAAKQVAKPTLGAGKQKIDLVLTAPRVPADVESGDYVGILASYSKSDGSAGKTSMALSRVLVVGVKDDVVGGTGDAAGGTGKRVTLAVSAEQAAKIANIAEFGKIWLTAQPEQTDDKTKTTETKDVS